MLHRQPILSSLFSNVDLAMLVYFRIAFGWTVFTWALTSLLKERVTAFFILPRFHFAYAGFDWVTPLAESGMVWLFWALAGSALAVIFGLLYRASSVFLAVGFTYVFLIDKAGYQNHYYLICLVSWIMPLLPAERAFSIDALLRPKIRSDVAPLWTLWLIRFQIAVPYFFGGVAKLDADWLRGQPLRDALAERASTPIIGGLLAQEWATWFFAYGGLLFDLLVVPALLWRVTRPWAFALAVLFHWANSQLFTIGVFPWFMILASLSSTSTWGRPSWVVPLTEPFRYHGWDVPLEKWEQHVEIPAFMQGKQGHGEDAGC